LAAPQNRSQSGQCGLRVRLGGKSPVAIDLRRTITLLTNHLGVPGPRIRGHQVAEILFGD
jgi:hypothetical protein